MGDKRELFVFDYQHYLKTIVPFLREVLDCRMPPSAYLKDVLERFESIDAPPIQFPSQPFCGYLVSQECCYCLRDDLGAEPDYYEYWLEVREHTRGDPQCGMRSRWTEEVRFARLFNALVAGNCLSHEKHLSSRMTHFVHELVAAAERKPYCDETAWYLQFPDFIKKALQLFAALYHRGVQFGEMGGVYGIQGWLTPEETVQLNEVISMDLGPPPTEPPADPYEEYYFCENLELHKQLQEISAMCKLAASHGSGLACSYYIDLRQWEWGKLKM
jgi:hypothetical protein